MMGNAVQEMGFLEDACWRVTKAMVQPGNRHFNSIKAALTLQVHLGTAVDCYWSVNDVSTTGNGRRVTCPDSQSD